MLTRALGARVSVCRVPTTRGRDAEAAPWPGAGEFTIDCGALLAGEGDVDRLVELRVPLSVAVLAGDTGSLAAVDEVFASVEFCFTPNELSYESTLFRTYEPCGHAADVRYATIT